MRIYFKCEYGKKMETLTINKKKKKKDEIRNDLYFGFCFCCQWLCFNFEICFIANVNDSSALAVNISVITATIKKY